ncbi:MAG TPA: NifB/NifX family molybdenum-iron cluster-binding protein [Bacteroidota bacterium]|nr:NifB/NifX family molybdenum-iron cluster-binding protein [Bacteroidota bacterium]
MDLKNASIAVATDDGTTVSSHFGRALYYEVIQFSNGAPVKRERREKAGHHSFAHHDHEEGHGHGEASEQKHRTMVSPILDCQALVVRGMGQGAVEHLKGANILPVLTGLHTINEVLEAVSADTLETDPSRIHHHHA